MTPEDYKKEVLKRGTITYVANRLGVTRVALSRRISGQNRVIKKEQALALQAIPTREELERQVQRNRWVLAGM